MTQEDKDKNKNGEGKNNLAENAKAIIFTVFIKALIFIAIIAIVFGLLGAAQFELRVQDAIWDEKDNEETSPDAYFESIYVAENGTLMAGLSVEELWEKEDVYSDYLSSIDALAYMLNAQVVTQYPYIEGASSDELNGTIRFYRNNSSQAMKYVDIATLNEYVSSYNSGNTDVLNDALSSFYLNSDGTISIAYLTEDEYEVTTYDVRAANDAEAQIGATATSVSRRYRIYRSESYLSIKNISYSNYIQNYVLPFNLLWAFTVYTRDGGEEFAHILASMAYEGEISLIINDNENIIQDTYTYTYDIESKQEIDGARAEISIATQDSESGDTISGYHRETTDEQFNTDEEVIERFDSSIPTIYVETHTTNTPSIALKGVVSWIATYENTNTFTTSQSSSDNSSGITPPESPTEWEVVDDSEEIWYFSEKYDGCQSVDLIDWANTQSILALQIYDGIATATLNEVTLVADVTTYERFVDIEVSYNETITRTQFSGGTSSVVFNQNLARILNVGEFSNVKKNVTDSYRNTDGYFRRIIRGNANTANLEDLIAYWFNEATGTNDFGDVEFDFNPYPGDFKDFGGEYGDWDGTGSQEDFIRTVAPYAVVDMYQHQIYASVTIAQAIIESGWGKDSIAINYKNFFGMKKGGGSPNEYWSGESVALRASEGGTSYFRVYDSLKNSIYDHGRNFHVTATYGNHGVLDCISQNLGPKEQLRRIAISGYAVYSDGSISRPDGVRTYDQYLYEEFIVKYNLEQYDTMTPDDFTSQSTSNQTGSEIVELARSKLGCRYVYGATGPDTFDCSGLVYWIHQQIGVTVPRSTEEYKDYLGTSVEISWDEIQEGDIVWRDGHMGIYIGNNQYIHAPHTGDVVKISSGASSEFTNVFRFIE